MRFVNGIIALFVVSVVTYAAVQQVERVDTDHSGMSRSERVPQSVPKQNYNYPNNNSAVNQGTANTVNRQSTMQPTPPNAPSMRSPTATQDAARDSARTPRAYAPTERNAANRNSTANSTVDQTVVRRDTEISRQIRQSWQQDRTLSNNAQNVQIMTQSGQVTLKGVVSSVAERDALIRKAQGVAGVSEVIDQTELLTK